MAGPLHDPTPDPPSPPARTPGPGQGLDPDPGPILDPDQGAEAGLGPPEVAQDLDQGPNHSRLEENVDLGLAVRLHLPLQAWVQGLEEVCPMCASGRRTRDIRCW